MIRREFELFADYFQIHLQDDDLRFGDLSAAWTADAVRRMIAVAPGVVGIGTARNMTVPVVVEVLRAEPAADLDGWDHVVDAGLDVTTGSLVVAGCTDDFADAVRIPIPPGLYRLRSSCAGLETLSEDGLAGEDHYRVQLWPAKKLVSPTVLKQGEAPK